MWKLPWEKKIMGEKLGRGARGSAGEDSSNMEHWGRLGKGNLRRWRPGLPQMRPHPAPRQALASLLLGLPHSTWVNRQVEQGIASGHLWERDLPGFAGAQRLGGCVLAALSKGRGCLGEDGLVNPQSGSAVMEPRALELSLCLKNKMKAREGFELPRLTHCTLCSPLSV